jgi:hypothetical protein
LCRVLRHNTRMCTAGPGLNYKREERARNWRVQEEFDDINSISYKRDGVDSRGSVASLNS